MRDYTGCSRRLQGERSGNCGNHSRSATQEFCSLIAPTSLYRLEPGETLSTSQGTRATGRAVGREPLFAVVVFSPGTQTAVNDENDGAA